MAIFSRIFRWRSRVKTGTPELAGNSIETLTSHVSDTSAHPDYFKKGAAVPTGQEAFAIAKHASSKIAHAPYELRRDEALKTLAQYEAAKGKDYVDDSNNFFKDAPNRHVLTAFVLGQILANYVDVDMFKNVVKRRYDENHRLGPVGDGSQLIYIADDADGFGYATVSTKNIGSVNRPVYVLGGVVKEIPYDCVVTGNVDQTINGVKTFVKIPKIENKLTMPIDDEDFVTVAYLKNLLNTHRLIPIGGIYVHSIDPTDGVVPAEDIGTDSYLGYGEWELHAYVGNFAVMYKRTA